MHPFLLNNLKQISLIKHLIWKLLLSVACSLSFGSWTESYLFTHQFWFKLYESTKQNCVYLNAVMFTLHLFCLSENNGQEKARGDELYFCGMPIVHLSPSSSQGMPIVFFIGCPMFSMSPFLYMYAYIFCRLLMPLIVYVVTKLWLANHPTGLGKISQSFIRILMKGALTVFCFLIICCTCLL